jgi:hypothetical protein
MFQRVSSSEFDMSSFDDLCAASNANPVQYHSTGRMVQVERSIRRDAVDGELDAGYQAVATQKGAAPPVPIGLSMADRLHVMPSPS